MVSTRLIVGVATTLAVLSVTAVAAAQDYYVDPAGNDSNAGTSEAEAWASLGPVESLGFGASGYTLRLKAGGQWTTGGLRITNSTITRYGDGAAPSIIGSGGGQGGGIISVSGGATVDGVRVAGQGTTGFSVMGSDNVVRNCEVDGSEGYLQLGFGIMGENNLITGNSVHDLSGMTGDSGDMNTSGGAEAYMVMASNNEISYNSAVNCWGPNETLGGAEGGCLEIVNGEALSTIENVRFHHNYCEKSVGLFEGCSGNFSGSDAIQENHGIIRDSLVAYNIAVDAMWLYLLQPVNTDFVNIVFEHNTIIHTPANEDIPQGGANSFGLLVNEDQGYTAAPLQPGSVIVRNNLFYVTGGGTAMFTEVPDHSYNLFAPSAPSGWTLGTGELTAADPGLTADYRLAAASPAIDAGSSEAWQPWTDFDGNAVPLGAAPDIGASEYCDGTDCAEPTDPATGGATSTGGSENGGAQTGGTAAGATDTGATASGASESGGTSSSAGGQATSVGGDSVGGATGSTGAQCAAGLALCGQSCVDLASDVSHCGTCGLACAAEQVCSAGTCSSVCAAGLVQCGQACVDLASNVLHCGACTAPCLAGQSCSGGQCIGSATGGAISQPVASNPATGGATTSDSLPGADEPIAVSSDPGCGCWAAGMTTNHRATLLVSLLGLLLLGRRARHAA